MDSLPNTQAYQWDQNLKAYVPAKKPLNKFLKGPIPWAWIEKAARLPGSALVVGLALWRLAGAMKSMTVRLATTETEALGVSRSTKSRALAELEGAGLVTIEQRPGCIPRVTILEVVA